MTLIIFDAILSTVVDPDAAKEAPSARCLRWTESLDARSTVHIQIGFLSGSLTLPGQSVGR